MVTYGHLCKCNLKSYYKVANSKCLGTFTLVTIIELLTIDKASWLEDVQNIKEFYAMIGDRVPAELYAELDTLIANLKK